ncbi:MAG: acyl-CoA dehydrogenase family protein, partial [Thermoanaerobaculia bacterium]
GKEEWKRCADLGLLGLPVSREYGGMGLDCLTTARALEALGNGCPDGGLGLTLGAHLLACSMPIELHGTAEQKQTYLPKLCSGEWIGANAITESEAGSDAFALKTRALKDGNDYVLGGEKTFVTNAPVADLFVVYASTRPEWGFLGISAFLVERDTPGLLVGQPFEKCGLATSPMSSLYLDDCRVPDSHRLGAEGMGGSIFQASIGWERSCLFAFWLGTMDRQLDEVIQHARSRHQFGRPIGANQAISHRIADMKLRLESARLLLYRACWERSRGHPSDLFTSLAKLAVSEAFLQSSLDAAQIFGGSGIVREVGIERYVRDALPGTIYSGTSEMQREIIARALGLPPQRRS